SSPVEILTLETDSHNEISEVWSDVILTLTVLSLFCMLNALLVFWITGRALRPLNDVIRAFDRIGAGDYPQQLHGGGPIEIRRLGLGVNQMVQKLSDMESRKRRLEEQLVAVQEEERTQLAQDLHDEIGPLLFAVSVDLNALQDHRALRADPQMWTRFTAMRDAVSRIQRHVKTILVQLRPPSVADLGLAHSIERMVAFWRTRYPAVAFRINVPTESFEPEIGSRIARIVQEGISNALRHGSPSSVEIEVLTDADGAIVLRICDDGAGLQPDGNPTGLGLRGMHDRVDSLGGVLTMTGGPNGQGVIISARFPAPAPVA
ncbi:MAG TPA: HAMP domain-containing protein, partial [Steroidobacteraceae bacterium]|nr:HAMP domain-containing protein [Steroidobacteraceae bacterium]